MIVSAMLGSGALAGAASWWFNRRQTAAETDHTQAEAAKDWVDIAKDAWERVTVLERREREREKRIVELESAERLSRQVYAAVLPILRRCANGHAPDVQEIDKVTAMIEARELDAGRNG